MKTIAILITITFCYGAYAQSTLDNYVKIGIANNLALQQHTLSFKKAECALKMAKGYFMPEASLQARYSLAQGGRTIDFPVGDMLNPVYTTLNQILEQQGQVAGFPMLNNQSIAFMRPQEYDAKLSIIQPVYSRSLGLNKKIAEQQLGMSAYEIELYKRELGFQIKEGYYNYLQTLQLMQLVDKTKETVNENLRITQKLFESNMIANDAVLRAKSDVSKVGLFETTVLKNKELARSYFNFLINRELYDDIEVNEFELETLDNDLNTFINNALSLREELKQLDSQTQIYELLAQMNTAENIPMLALALDAGVQGDDFSNVSAGDYIMGSLVLNWKLFNGNINRNKRQQAQIEKEKSELQKQEATQQIMLEIKRDYLEVQELKQNLELALSRSAVANEGYRILEKRYRQGEASLIELLDARNNMVEAESDYITTKFKLRISLARLEKSSATALR